MRWRRRLTCSPRNWNSAPCPCRRWRCRARKNRNPHEIFRRAVTGGSAFQRQGPVGLEPARPEGRSDVESGLIGQARSGESEKIDRRRQWGGGGFHLAANSGRKGLRFDFRENFRRL